MSKHADADDRAKRTAIQGLITVVAITVIGVVIQALTASKPEDLVSPAFWGPVGLLSLQVGLMAGLAYVQKRLEERGEGGYENED